MEHETTLGPRIHPHPNPLPEGEGIRGDTVDPPQQTTSSNYKNAAIFVGLTLLLLVLLFARSMSRDLDPDEHQFVAPPALLAQFHLLPYRDYPYFHMPDLVFLLAGLTGWTSWKLLAARTVSVLCGTATVALLFAAGWRRLAHLPPRWRAAIAAGLCVILINGRLFTYTDGWAWNHDSAVLCALGAVLLHLRGRWTGRLMTFALAGLLVGLAIGIRLSFAMLPIALAVDLFSGPLSLRERVRVRVGSSGGTVSYAPNHPHPNPLPEGKGTGGESLSGRQRVLILLVATAAALLALSPAIWLAALAPHRFWFGNFGYPALSTAYYRTWERHGMTFVTKIGLALQKFVSDPGDAALMIGFVAAVVWRWRASELWPAASRQRFRLLLLVLIALWIGVMGPTPIQPQYNYMLLPFMILAMIEAAGTLPAPRVRPLARTLAGVAVVLAAIGLPRWYWGVLRLPTPSRWTPVQRHRLALWIRSQTGPAARVLTIEPAIPLEAGLAIYPQYAVGRFVLLVTNFQPPEQRGPAGMVGPAELPALLAQEPPDAILVQQLPSQDQVDRSFIRYAQQHHLKLIHAPDGKHELWIQEGVTDLTLNSSNR